MPQVDGGRLPDGSTSEVFRRKSRDFRTVTVKTLRDNTIVPPPPLPNAKAR